MIPPENHVIWTKSVKIIANQKKKENTLRSQWKLKVKNDATA